MMTTIKVPIPEKGKNNLESKLMKIQAIKSDPVKYQKALRDLIDGPLKKARQFQKKLKGG